MNNLLEMLQLCFLRKRIRFIQNEIVREMSRLEHCRICIEGDKALEQKLLNEQLQLEGSER